MITASTYKVPTIYDELYKDVQSRTADTAGDCTPVTVAVPGSKSITNRALLLAMLAEGESTLDGVLFSDDSRHFLKCLQDLGFETRVDEAGRRICVKGLGGKLPVAEASLNVGSAGTAARFLTASLGLLSGTFHMNSSEQMKRRPMSPLLNSLKELGCEVTYEEKEGFFPFTINAHGFGKDEITVDIDKSSQFLSALLIAAPLSGEDFTIHVEGTHGMAYIDMTCKMMEEFGVRSEHRENGDFFIPGGQHSVGRDYLIEPDVSAACYFYGMAAILGTSVVVKNVFPDRSMQGDIAFLSVLEKMGCTLSETPDGICVTGPEKGQLRGITADLSAFSDQAITLAAIAPYADSPVTITGIGHIRGQESDRLAAMAENLTAMGIHCDESADAITIYPGPLHGASVHTHDDHRLAMGFALTGLRTEGIIIEDPGCCRKTFEDYFETLEAAVAQLHK